MFAEVLEDRFDLLAELVGEGSVDHHRDLFDSTDAGDGDVELVYHRGAKMLQKPPSSATALPIVVGEISLELSSALYISLS